MRFEIGRSFADIEVLLGTLQGTHRSPRSSVVTSAVLGLIMCWAAAVIFQQGVADDNPADRVFGIVAGVSMLAFGAAVLADKLSTYRIDERGITKKHPVAALSWSVDRSEIHAITLVLERGWSLEIETSASKKRSLELEGSVRDALTKLYPEVAPYQVTARDRRRWKWMALITAATVAIGGAIVWWLTLRGVLYWP